MALADLSSSAYSFLQLARQIDFIQNYLKDNFESFSSGGSSQPQITVTQGGAGQMSSNMIALQSQMKRPIGSVMGGPGQPGMQPYPPPGGRAMMHMESIMGEPDNASRPY